MSIPRKHIAVLLFNLVLVGSAFSFIPPNDADQVVNKNDSVFNHSNTGLGYVSFLKCLAENEDGLDNFSDNFRTSSFHYAFTISPFISFIREERIFRLKLPRKKVYLLHAVFLI
jgi:hypothetical protein